ncbi:MAG: hypothetical protein ACK44E_07785 [Anaerolineales bacterium]
MYHCFSMNCYCGRWRSVRRLRQELNRQFGWRSSPVFVFAAGAFTILPLEELVLLLGGVPPQFSFLNRKSLSYEPT